MPTKKKKQRQGNKPKSITIWRWPLPQDTRRTLRDFEIGKTPQDLLQPYPDNPALLLQRYVAYPHQESKPADSLQSDEAFAQEVFKKTVGKWVWGKSGKSDFWGVVVQRIDELYRNQTGVTQAQRSLQGRQQMLEDLLRSQCYKVRAFLVEVAWRLVVGLGLPSPLETGITLHHLYGIPYLPGSAIKGVTRNWRLQQIADKLGVPRLSTQHISIWKKDKGLDLTPWERLEQLLASPAPSASDNEERKSKLLERIKRYRDGLQNALERDKLREWGYLINSSPQLPDAEELIRRYIQDFSRAFGSTEAKGEVVFLDAYPESLTTASDQPILELDVMNPHYSKYYQREEPPADWLSPMPIFFLTIRQRTRFVIRLAGKDPDLLGKVEGWARNALQEFGLGAKTRAGYGELAGVEEDRVKLASEAKAEEQIESLAVEKDLGPETRLVARIERWTPREMGTIQQLVEQISSLPDPESRCRLARRLQQKLQEGKKWGKEYQDRSWHQALEGILASEECQPST